MNQASNAVKWEDALKITEVKNVDDALRAFTDSASEDNAVGLVQCVIEAYKQQERDRVTILFMDDLHDGGDLFADGDEELVSLAQKRVEDPKLTRGREMVSKLLMDGRRFRAIAYGLMLAAKEDDPEADAAIQNIDVAVDEIVGDNVQPSLKLIRDVIDALYARGLLKEIEDEAHDDKAAG